MLHPADRVPDVDEPLLIGVLLRLAVRAWGDDVDEALRRAGFADIRPAHANVFPFVPAEGIQVSELAKRGRMRKQSMAKAVQQLEELGYVRREPDPGDRRAQLVFLTERGQRMRPVGKQAGKAVEKRWAELIGDGDVEALRTALMRLLEALELSGGPSTPSS